MASSRDKYRSLVERPRWTEAEGRVAVEGWRRSGQSLETFSDESGISTWRLKAWSERLDGSNALKSRLRRSVVRGESGTVELVPAVITNVCGDTPAVVIRLPDGLEVEIRNERIDMEDVGRLVTELRRGGA